jgi:hypothetical protein
MPLKKQIVFLGCFLVAFFFSSNVFAEVVCPTNPPPDFNLINSTGLNCGTAQTYPYNCYSYKNGNHICRGWYEYPGCPDGYMEADNPAFNYGCVACSSPNEVYNNECVASCIPPNERDPETGQCVSNACEEGQDVNTGCSCADPMIIVGTQCVTDVCSAAPTSGMVQDPSGNCVCPVGSIPMDLDNNGSSSCEPIEDCNPSTPGFMGYVDLDGDPNTNDEIAVCSGSQYCGPGESPGYVNGVLVCVAESPDCTGGTYVNGVCVFPVPTPDPTPGQTTNPDGSVSTTTQSTSTNADGSTTTTTTTTESQNADGSTTVSTVTETTNITNNIDGSQTTTTTNNYTSEIVFPDEGINANVDFSSIVSEAWEIDPTEKSNEASAALDGTFDGLAQDIEGTTTVDIPQANYLQGKITDVFNVNPQPACDLLYLPYKGYDLLSMDCQRYEPVRNMLSYVFYVMTLITIFNIATRKPQE